MDDSFGSKLDVTLDEKTKNVDDVIPVPEDDASSMQSSIPSLIKDADSYVRGLFSGIMNPSSDDDSSVADGKKEKKEDEEEEEEKPLLVSMKDAFTSLFDKRGVAILLLLFLVGCVVYMHKHGYLANFARALPISFLTGEGHDHHHHAHAGCTCKNKGAKPVNNSAPAGECPCQRAKRLAEAQAAGEHHHHHHHDHSH